MLSILFTKAGVPPACISDDANKLVKGKFNLRFKDTSYQLKNIEPYTPWSNATESGIKKLKEGANRKFMKCIKNDYQITV